MKKLHSPIVIEQKFVDMSNCFHFIQNVNGITLFRKPYISSALYTVSLIGMEVPLGTQTVNNLQNHISNFIWLWYDKT